MSHLARSIVRRVPRRSFAPRRSASSNSRWLLPLSAFAGSLVATAVGGYALYRWSGIGDVVDTINHFTQKSEYKRDSQNQTAPQLFSALRVLAKSYVVGIPGAGFLVDSAFYQVEGIVKAHQNEARAILKTAMENIQNAVKTHGANSTAAAWAVLIILRDKLGQIQASASEVNQTTIGPLFENFQGFHEHASKHIPKVLASAQSLWSAGLKGLEKGKNLLLEASERRKSDSIPSVEETISTDSTEGKTSTQDSSTDRSGGNVV